MKSISIILALLALAVGACRPNELTIRGDVDPQRQPAETPTETTATEMPRGVMETQSEAPIGTAPPPDTSATSPP